MGYFVSHSFKEKKPKCAWKGKNWNHEFLWLVYWQGSPSSDFLVSLSTIRSISILLLCLKMLLILVICLLFFKGKKLYFSEDGKVQRYWEMLSNLARIPKSDMLEGFFQNYLWSIPNYLFFITYKTNWQWKLKQTACYPY